MKVLLPISDTQTIKIRPRFVDLLVTVVLRNELTDEITEKDPIIPVVGEDFISIGVTHPFQEGENYEIQIFAENGDVMWRGKMFITEQEDLQNYNIYHE